MADTFDKDPNAVLDYAFDWRMYTNQGKSTDWLAADETISSYVITCATGITKVSDSQADGVVTVWLSGGTDNTSYTVACRITTSAGRVDERTMTINCRER